MKNRLLKLLLPLIIVFISLGFEARALTLVDSKFNKGLGAQNGFVESMVVQPDGKILICGNFTSFNGQPKGYIARLNTDGSVDTTFTTQVGYWVRHMALQADGKILIGGFFGNVGYESRQCIARLNANGSLDTTFNPGSGASGTLGVAINGNADPFIFQIAVQRDGKIVITGNFTTYNGVPMNGIARLNANGTLDSTFQVGSGLNTWGRSIQVLSNDKILVTGWFDNYNNSIHDRMVLINPDGSPDNSFLPYFGDRTAVYTAAQLANGQYLVGGHSLNYDGLFHEEIRRLNPDGSVDPAFIAQANEKIQSITVQANGKILLVGEFNVVNNVSCTSIARLNPNGSLDTSFSATVDNWAWTGAIQSDGKILFCGGFTTVNGLQRVGIARFLNKN